MVRLLVHYVIISLCLALLSKRTDTAKTNTDVEESTKKVRNGRGRHGRDEGVCDLEISCRGDPEQEVEESGGGSSAPVRLPIRGPRGPEGTPGLKGESGKDGLQGLPGLPGISAPVPQKIAFFAGLSDNLGPVEQNSDIVFDSVITNVGSAYDVDSGHFTAPVNGTYQFNVVLSAQGRQKAAVMLVKNSDMVITVWAESIPFWSTASNIAVLNLNKGDLIRLVLLSRASYVHGYMYTTFSGFLLF